MAFFLYVFAVLASLIRFSQAQVSETTTTSIRGPHPSDVAPSYFVRDKLADVEIPLISETCTQPLRPVVNKETLQRSFNGFDMYSFFASVTWCVGGNSSRLRVRFLRYNGSVRRNKNRTNVTTTVIGAYIQEGFPASISTFVRPVCFPKPVYAEVCGKRPGQARPICSMSFLQPVPAARVPAPRVAFRPPYILRLAPLDTVKITYRIINTTSYGPLSNTQDFPPQFNHRTYWLRPVVFGRTGKKLFGPARKFAERVVARIGTRKRPLSVGRWNNATAFLQFGFPPCRFLDSFEDRFPTRIIINPKVASMSKQDTKVPEFPQPVFPPTRINDSVTIKVNARNVGGGRRADGTPTELHYQWLLQSDSGIPDPYYPKPIPGQTGSTFRIDKLQCIPLDYGTYGANNQQQYYVDVCNTFGCKRSGPIDPVYISPSPPKQIDTISCELE